MATSSCNCGRVGACPNEISSIALSGVPATVTYMCFRTTDTAVVYRGRCTGRSRDGMVENRDFDPKRRHFRVTRIARVIRYVSMYVFTSSAYACSTDIGYVDIWRWDGQSRRARAFHRRYILIDVKLYTIIYINTYGQTFRFYRREMCTKCIMATIRVLQEGGEKKSISSKYWKK